MITMTVEEAKQIIAEHSRLSRLECLNPDAPSNEREYKHVSIISKEKYLAALRIVAGAALMPPSL